MISQQYGSLVLPAYQKLAVPLDIARKSRQKTNYGKPVFHLPVLLFQSRLPTKPNPYLYICNSDIRRSTIVTQHISRVSTFIEGIQVMSASRPCKHVLSQRPAFHASGANVSRLLLQDSRPHLSTGVYRERYDLGTGVDNLRGSYRASR